MAISQVAICRVLRDESPPWDQQGGLMCLWEGTCPQTTQLSPPLTSQISAIIHSHVLSSCFLPVQFWAAQNRGTQVPRGRDPEEGKSKVTPEDDLDQGGKCLRTYMQTGWGGLPRGGGNTAASLGRARVGGTSRGWLLGMPGSPAPVPATDRKSLRVLK